MWDETVSPHHGSIDPSPAQAQLRVEWKGNNFIVVTTLGKPILRYASLFYITFKHPCITSPPTFNLPLLLVVWAFPAFRCLHLDMGTALVLSYGRERKICIKLRTIPHLAYISAAYYPTLTLHSSDLHILQVCGLFQLEMKQLYTYRCLVYVLINASFVTAGLSVHLWLVIIHW